MDTKRDNPGPQGPQGNSPDGSEGRRAGRIVHDHKGTARVEWVNAPGRERVPLEIEGARPAAAKPAPSGLRTGSLGISNDDSFDPYTRIPEVEKQRLPRKPTDLRKLSAWIKLMRSLEEAKTRDDGEE